MSASELDLRRAHECRLVPDRALVTLDDAAAWLDDRGLTTLMPCCSLPSLFAACHEEPYAPAKAGFGQWPKTRYWWPWGLTEREGFHSLKIHRGKVLLVADRIAALCDPLCRAALADADEGALGEDVARLVAHLAAAGPSLVPELKEEVGGDVRRARAALERAGAVVSRESELLRWDQAFPEPSPGGFDELLLAGVRAAVVAPEPELRTWFTWPLPSGTVDRLVEEGRLARAAGAVSLASDS